MAIDMQVAQTDVNNDGAEHRTKSIADKKQGNERQGIYGECGPKDIPQNIANTVHLNQPAREERSGLRRDGEE